MNMKRMTKWFVALATAVLGAVVTRAGDSAPFALDTRTGTRIARETEPIAYSTEWSRGGNVQVSVDGVPLKEAGAPATGTVVWNAAEAGPGVHVLTHVSGGTTLTAQFAVFGVQVESADPAEGSITLAWTDLGNGVTYSIYRGAGEERLDAYLVTNGVTGTNWPDKSYWNMEPVTKPLNYWVVADGGGYGKRESKPVETRRRFGVFVGVGKYKNGGDTPDPSDISNARLFGDLALEKGGFANANVQVITGSGATKSAVRKALQTVAGQMQTGDYAALFFSSHGDAPFWQRVAKYLNGNVGLEFSSLSLYDGAYGKNELGEDLRKMVEGKSGVGVAIVLNACLSGGAVSASSADGQIAWITSCSDGEITPSWTETIGTPLPQFLLEYGWKRGRAGSGEYVTFAELADYALPALGDFLDKTGKVTHPIVKGEDVLAHFIAGRHGSATHATTPGVPSGVSATENEENLHVSWNGVSGADWIILRRTDIPDGNLETGVLEGTKTGCSDPSADLYGKDYFYRVAAMNEWGVGGWSDAATGSRRNPELVEWVTQQCGCDENATPATLAAAAATPTLNGESYEACYIAGLNPTNANEKFETSIRIEDGDTVVEWNPDLNEGGTKNERIYTVYGKKDLTNEAEDWLKVADPAHPEADGYRFFRVGVSLPNE